jgi:hypothetical protein
MQLLFEFIKKLWPRWFHYFLKILFLNHRTGGSVSFENRWNPRNTRSGYVKNLKEPAGSIKDPAMNWWVFLAGYWICLPIWLRTMVIYQRTGSLTFVRTTVMSPPKAP